MAKGKSKAGGGAGSAGISYKNFMAMSEEAKDEFIKKAVDETTVPDGIKDTPTMRVLVALGLNGKPNMVEDSTLDNMQGQELFRTISDQYDYNTKTTGLSSKAIAKQFTTSDYTSLSDTNGSSEGRGYYFAKDLHGATQWGLDGGRIQPSNLTMRAKLKPSAKMADIDEIFYGSARKEYIGDKHFINTVSRNVPAWDALSIWLIKKGYQGAHATDSGTGAKEVVMFDRSALAISKKFKKIPNKDNYTWNDMK